MRGKLNELWALVGAVSAARERDRKGGSDGNVEWAVVDDEGLAQIAQVRVRAFFCYDLRAYDLGFSDFGRAASGVSSSDKDSAKRFE